MSNIGKSCSKCNATFTLENTRGYGLICKHCYNKYRREKYGMNPRKRSHCKDCNTELNEFNRVILKGVNRNCCRECWNNTIRSRKGLEPIKYVYCQGCNRFLSTFHAKGGYCKQCRPKELKNTHVKKSKRQLEKPKQKKRPKNKKQIPQEVIEPIYVQKKQKTIIPEKIVVDVEKTEKYLIEEWLKNNKPTQLNKVYGV